MDGEDYQKTELWKLKGPVDVGCAQCGEIGAELRIEVLMGMAAKAQPDGFQFEMNVLDGDLPVEMECLHCGAVVKFGPTVEVGVD